MKYKLLYDSALVIYINLSISFVCLYLLFYNITSAIDYRYVIRSNPISYFILHLCAVNFSISVHSADHFKLYTINNNIFVVMVFKTVNHVCVWASLRLTHTHTWFTVLNRQSVQLPCSVVIYNISKMFVYDHFNLNQITRICCIASNLHLVLFLNNILRSHTAQLSVTRWSPLWID